MQVEYHPHLVQSALLHYCAGRGVHFQAYSSLGTTSKDNQLLTDPVVVRIANLRGKTPAQILLQFAFQEGIGKSRLPSRGLNQNPVVAAFLKERIYQRFSFLQV
jgi:diketogulonate reductase-like aldo/keto reductase